MDYVLPGMPSDMLPGYAFGKVECVLCKPSGSDNMSLRTVLDGCKLSTVIMSRDRLNRKLACRIACFNTRREQSLNAGPGGYQCSEKAETGL